MDELHGTTDEFLSSNAQDFIEEKVDGIRQTWQIYS